MPLLLLRSGSRATAMVSWGQWPVAASMGQVGLAESRGSTMPLLQAYHAQWSKTLFQQHIPAGACKITFG